MPSPKLRGQCQRSLNTTVGSFWKDGSLNHKVPSINPGDMPELLKGACLISVVYISHFFKKIQFGFSLSLSLS